LALFQAVTASSGAVLSARAASGAAGPVDPAGGPVLYRGGTVFTGRTNRVDARWFVVDGGRFVDVGEGEVPERWRSAQAVELAGQFVAPGFVDAHVHFVDGGLGLLQVDAGDARSVDDVRAAVARAAAQPLAGWVVVRNVGLDVLGGGYPSHENLRAVVGPAGDRPLLLLVKGGHHVYANPAALARLSIGASTPDPDGGTIVRDSAGAPSGLLVDQAAWDAVRALESELPPETLARAILAAQRLAVRFGITTIGDNTFFPASAVMYARMAKADLLRPRIDLRSFGPEPFTRLSMKSIGAGAFGRPGSQLQYFGDKYFLDGALSTGGARVAGVARIEAGPRMSVEQLRDAMLFAGPFGTAFHTQSREGARRLAEAREPIMSRRRGAGPDVIDHCGRCGGGGLPERLRAAGFRVTVLPGQLHELPALTRDLPPSDHGALLQLRELFQAGLEPALTSDWPFGAEVSYPDLPDSLHRIGLAPLSNVAVATTGRAPNGERIAGTEPRTITMGEALLGVTAYGARAIGREDVGRIVPGARADFVVLPVSPFEVDPVRLYRIDARATFIDGRAVWGDPTSVSVLQLPADTAAADFSTQPTGRAFSPIFGYDPVPGFLVGAAYFFFPYTPRGWRGSVQAYGSVTQLRGYLEAEAIGMRTIGPSVSPHLWVRANTLEERYFGVGMDTLPGSYIKTDPLRVDGAVGLVLDLSRRLSLGLDLRGGGIRDGKAAAIESFSGSAEGQVNGAFGGVHLELAHDSRDSAFATRSGGRELLWTETFAVEESRGALRQRAGLTVSRFIPLRAPDLTLALRVLGATSFGHRAYATDFALGGADVLRGYYGNRFRGDHLIAATAELRIPLAGPFSAATFGELGRVWATLPSGGVNRTQSLGRSAGFGLRYGLPPDRLVRLRLDAGFAPDQWGIFFKFDEAF
jgi:predicted amidohydrolase YtcJ